MSWKPGCWEGKDSTCLRKVHHQTHSSHSAVGLVHEGTRDASLETCVTNDGDEKVRVDGKDHCVACFIHGWRSLLCIMATVEFGPFRFEQGVKWLWLEREKHAWPSWMDRVWQTKREHF